MNPDSRPLPRWMHLVLRIAGCYNIGAGLAMMILYHEGYKLLGIAKPELTLPIQLVGLMVGLFGVAYLVVDRHPLNNRNLLRLGFCTKALGPVLATGYVIGGVLPWTMLVVLWFADLIYLIPFFLIDRQIGKLNAPIQLERNACSDVGRRRAA